MSKILDKYNELKEKDKEKMYMFKSGKFYIFVSEDCDRINEYVVLKKVDFSNTYKCGFPNIALDDYLRVFKNHNLDIEIITDFTLDNGNVEDIIRSVDTTNTTDVEGVSCATPMTTNGTGECNNGEWMTHPAFISMNVDGFWVGKFEIGNKLNTTGAAKTAMTSSTVSNVVVKPDYYAWTKTSAIDFFNLLKTYNSDLDSHMIKNTEWGAIAYLSHSIYGKDSEININNNTYDATYSYSKTGYSSKSEIDQYAYSGTYGQESKYHTPWNTENGYRASTTGNISGIYDMSGGSREYVAGIGTGVSITGDTKYYDSYNSSSGNANYKIRILGDATGEMGPFNYYQTVDGVTCYHNWYSDQSSFVTTSYPWFERGGRSADYARAGVFSFSNNGSAEMYCGSRIVLSPKD